VAVLVSMTTLDSIFYCLAFAFPPRLDKAFPVKRGQFEELSPALPLKTPRSSPLLGARAIPRWL
jgi:hypothetical protein